MTPKIVVTKDLSFYSDQLARLKTFGDVTLHDTEAASSQQWLERCVDADIICTGMFGFKSEELYTLHDVFISLPFVGVEYLDTTRLKDKNITVANAPGCNKEAVVEWCIGMMLMVTRNLNTLTNTSSQERDTILQTGITLYGKNITILGKGNIGKHLGTICTALGMNVSFFERGDNIIQSTQDADVVANCLSVTTDTIGLLDAGFFDSLKDGALFVSSTRHQTYDIKALEKNLKTHKLMAAIDDAADSRVGDTDESIYQELKGYPNMYVTPHIAWCSEVETRKANDIMIDNIEAWLKKEPINIV